MKNKYLECLFTNLTVIAMIFKFNLKKLSLVIVFVLYSFANYYCNAQTNQLSIKYSISTVGNGYVEVKNNFFLITSSTTNYFDQIDPTLGQKNVTNIPLPIGAAEFEENIALFPVGGIKKRDASGVWNTVIASGAADASEISTGIVWAILGPNLRRQDGAGADIAIPGFETATGGVIDASNDILLIAAKGTSSTKLSLYNTSNQIFTQLPDINWYNNQNEVAKDVSILNGKYYVCITSNVSSGFFGSKIFQLSNDLTTWNEIFFEPRTSNPDHYVRDFAGVIGTNGKLYFAVTIESGSNAKTLLLTSYELSILISTLANSITATSSIVGGDISSDGGATITSRGICWSTASSPTIANNSLTSGTGTGQFNVTVQNLNPNTTYHYRAFAINSVGVAYGDGKTFTTLAALPILTTTTISAITSNSAASGGNITNDGNATITNRGICWSTTASPTIANNSTINGTGTGQFTSNLANLQPNTKYYVRSYAINLAGISYGNEISFTTLANLPTLTTTAISGISANSAASGGNITNDGNGAITARGVCWSTNQNPTTADNKTIDGTGNGQFTSNLTSLQANTKYYVRAYATNSAGTAYGSEVSFTTLTTGIELITDKNVFVYPNPTNNILLIKGLSDKLKISIYDINGKLIFNKQMINNQIDISNLTNGIYTIKIETAKGYLTQKFVKQ